MFPTGYQQTIQVDKEKKLLVKKAKKEERITDEVKYREEARKEERERERRKRETKKNVRL